MNKYLRYLFYLLIIKPLIFFLLGLNIRHRERLPLKGPAILVANHNSHIDTFVLMSLFPLAQQQFVRPVAAADYFLGWKPMAWFSKKVLGIIPIQRARPSPGVNPFAPISEALNNNGIIIFYPEGTRGEPETPSKLKSGIAYLAKDHPNVNVYPLFMYGAGKALPKGEALLVPFSIDLYVGLPLQWNGDKERFMQKLENTFNELKTEANIEARNDFNS